MAPSSPRTSRRLPAAAHAPRLALPAGARGARGPRGGAALMLSLLVLLVLVAVVFQINIATTTDARVARNDVAMTTMDLAIESALLETFEQLLSDAESEAAGSGAGAMGGMGAMGAMGGRSQMPGGLGGLGGAPGGMADGAPTGGANDSRRDDWARPQRTEINGVSLRVLIEDESRKLNVLSMLTPDEEQSERAFQRVARVFDLFREGTDGDLSSSEADAAARALLEHLRRRDDSRLPRAPLITDDPTERDVGMPLTLREVVVLPPFEAGWFREERDSQGRIMHGLERYLTVWSSMQTQEDLIAARSGGAAPPPGAGGGGGGGGAATPPAPQSGTGQSSTIGTGSLAPGGGGAPAGPGVGGSGGAAQGAPGALGAGGASAANDTPAWRVNLNTAPPVVLKALTDDREVHPRFWDDVIEHRNEEDETAEDPDADPVLDEYGEEVIVRKFFSTVQELEQLDEWVRLEPKQQNEILGLVGVSSQVFTIYVTARIDTDQSRAGSYGMTREEQEAYEESAGHLVRTVRCVVWRRPAQDGHEIVPIQRWKVLDHSPYEILDYPEDDR